MNLSLFLMPLALMMSLGVVSCGTRSSPAQARPPAEATTKRTNNMRILLKLEDRTLMGTLYDSPSARDFASMLPLTLTLEDYAQSEKISDLPRKLTREGAPATAGGSPGAIAYYAPWGNFALFYKQARPAAGLILLGQLDGNAEALSGPESMKVTIELVSAESKQD